MAKIERTKNATRNVIFGIILKTYQIIVPFLMRTAMIYLMGVEYLGLNSLFASVLQVLNLAELGVGSAMVYSMYKPIAEDDNEKICSLMQLYKIYYRVIGAVIAALGIMLTPFISQLVKGDVPYGVNIYVLYLLNLATTVLSYWLFAYKNCILQAYQRADISSKVLLFTTTVQYLLQFLVLFFFKNYYYFIVVALMSQVMTNIITAWIANKLYPQYKASGKLERREVKKINKRIQDLFTAKLGSTIVSSADTIVISACLGLTTLAEYQNYYYIMASIISFITILMTSCTAGIGNSIVTETAQKNYRDFKKLNLLITWISGICVCCFLNIYQPFMDLWMGKEHLLSNGCVILLCMYFYLFITNHLMATYKDAAGMWHQDRFRPLIAALVNLILNLLLVNKIGIFAIILSTVLSYAVVNMPWLIHNLFSVVFSRSAKEFIWIYLRGIVIVVFTAMLSYLACSILPSSGIMTIVIRVFFCLIISNVSFVCLLTKGKEYNELLDMMDYMTRNHFHKIIYYLKRKER